MRRCSRLTEILATTVSGKLCCCHRLGHLHTNIHHHLVLTSVFLLILAHRLLYKADRDTDPCHSMFKLLSASWPLSSSYSSAVCWLRFARFLRYPEILLLDSPSIFSHCNIIAMPGDITKSFFKLFLQGLFTTILL